MSRRIARPYATALFQVVEKQDPSALRPVQGQLERIADVLAREPRVLRVFEVPGVPPATKRALLDTLGRTLELRVETRRMLAALAQHFRMRSLGEVAAAFRDLVDRREGVQRGRVELPVPPGPRELDALSTALAALSGSRIELESRVRPELLAGFIVRIGSRVYDGSLRAQLARFTAAAARH